MMRTFDSRCRGLMACLVFASGAVAHAEIRRVSGGEAWSSPSSVIFSASRAQIAYEATNAPGVQSVSYSVQDETGAYLRRDAALTAAGANRWAIELATPGYYIVTVRAQMSAGGSEENRTIAAVLGSRLDDALRMKSRFGVWTVSHEPALSVLAGSRWDRVMWTNFAKTTQEAAAIAAEPKPLKRAPENNVQNDMELIGCFAGGLPPWLMTIPPGYQKTNHENPFYPAKDWQKLTQAVSAFATASSMPDLIEMYNEPDLGWRGNDAELVRYAHAMRAGLKAVDPRFKLLGPGFSQIHAERVQRVIQNGLLDEIDGFIIHGYVYGTPPEADFHGRLKMLRSMLRQAGKPDMPIYITEFGWTRTAGTWQTPVDDLTQARYCARSLLLGMAEDIKLLLYFCLQYHAKNPGEAGFSLISKEGYVSPGYVSYATVAKFFAAAEPVGNWSLTPTTKLVLAQRDGHVLAAIWDMQAARQITLPWPVASAIDMMGRPVEVEANNTLTVGPSPVYLQLNMPSLVRVQTAALAEYPLLLDHTRDLRKNSMVRLAEDITPGSYTVFTPSESGWSARQLTLLPPIQIVEAKVQWPAGRENPQLRVRIKSNLQDQPVRVQTRVGESEKTQSCAIAPQSEAVVMLPLSVNMLASGQRSYADIQVEAAIGSAVIRLKERTEVTLVFAPQAPKVRDTSWPAAAAFLDFTNWGPFPDDFKPDATLEDCRGKFRAMYGADGLRMNVVVTDDEFESPESIEDFGQMWTHDSIQLGLDVNALVGNATPNRHIFGFTMRQAQSGKALVYQQASTNIALPVNQLAANVAASITHDRNTIVYDLFFPWTSLGIDRAPQAGQAIRMALLVNDKDPRTLRPRHGLQFFGGIVKGTDAAQFGYLWLR